MKEIRIDEVPKYIEYIEYDDKYKKLLEVGGRFFINENPTLTNGYYYLMRVKDYYELIGPCYEYYLKEDFINNIQKLLSFKIDREIVLNVSFDFKEKILNITHLYNDNSKSEEIFEDVFEEDEEVRRKIREFDEKIKELGFEFKTSNIGSYLRISECNFEEACQENNFRENEYDVEYKTYFEEREYVFKMKNTI